MAVVLLVTAVAILASVAMHFAALKWFSHLLRSPQGPLRRAIGLSVLGLLVVHIAEAMLFALAYMGLASTGDFGALTGMEHRNFAEYCYYSLVAYTSLGFGDILPTGDLRLLTALETLTGLTLIAWSASFLYLQMSLEWDQGE